MLTRSLAYLAWAWLVLQPRAAAASAGGTVAVLRDGDAAVAADVASAIDDALVRDLRDLAGLSNPTVLPVSFEDTQFNLGCEGQSRSCLASIAQTVGVDALVIRKLSTSGGSTTLALSHFDARADADAVSVETSVPVSAQADLEAKVPQLVRELFGLSRPIESAAIVPAAVAAESTPEPEAEPSRSVAADDTTEDYADSESGGGSVGAGTWVLLISGAAVLGTGVALGAVAKGDFAEFKQLPTTTPSQAQEAHDAYDAVSTKSTVANVLMPVGGALLAAGTVFLILNLTSDDAPHDDHASLGIVPLRGGAALSLAGTYGGL